LEANLSIIEQLRPVAAQMEITLPQLALAWVLRRSEMTAAIAGARRPEQILETVKAGEIVIPDELLLKIERMLSA
jgi:aryl-alcohol dehydrogenase-like predicted oxidoreductase